MDKKGQNPRKNSKELGVVLVKPKRPDIGSRLSRKFSGNTSFTSDRKSSLNKTQRPEVRKNSNQSEFKFEYLKVCKDLSSCITKDSMLCGSHITI